jgi:hypothetical protein
MKYPRGQGKRKGRGACTPLLFQESTLWTVGGISGTKLYQEWMYGGTGWWNCSVPPRGKEYTKSCLLALGSKRQGLFSVLSPGVTHRPLVATWVWASLQYCENNATFWTL